MQRQGQRRREVVKTGRETKELSGETMNAQAVHDRQQVNEEDVVVHVRDVQQPEGEVEEVEGIDQHVDEQVRVERVDHQQHQQEGAAEDSVEGEHPPQGDVVVPHEVVQGSSGKVTGDRGEVTLLVASKPIKDKDAEDEHELNAIPEDGGDKVEDNVGVNRIHHRTHHLGHKHQR